jgi:antagonist of KipI
MIKILKPGILDTFQDQGRHGYAKWGVNVNGAMDQFALAAGNALVGNEINTCALEMHFPAAEILFSRETLISITGADFSPAINGHSIPGWKTIQVPAGAVLNFGKRINGMRSYLSVHGGFANLSWLGSSSTNLKSKTGGLEGRALKRGDEIQINTSNVSIGIENAWHVFPWSVSHNFVYDDDNVLILPGNEWNWVNERSLLSLLTEKLTIESSSDRMASFIRNEPLTFIRKDQLLSSAVNVGTIQGLPSGKLCVLMADHQTTGGYPRIAHVVSAHLPKFSQITPGQPFQFSLTTIAEAEKMLLSLQETLLNLKEILYKKLSDHYGFD